MRHLRLPPTVALTLALLVGGIALPGVASIRPALADPPPAAGDAPDGASALSQLSEDELALLRRKLPDWDALDAERRERIAARVLGLRRLSAEQRHELEARAARFRDRPAHGGGGERGRAALPALVGHLLGERLAGSLPEDLRARLEAGGLGRRDLSRYLVKALWPEIVQFEGRRLAEQGLDDLPEGVLSPADRERLAAAVARARALPADGDEAREAHAHLGHQALAMRLATLRRDLDGADPAAAGRVLGDRLWARWQPLREAAVARLRQDGAERIVQGMRRGEVLGQVMALERLLHGGLAGPEHDEARTWADRLSRHLMVHGLGLSPEVVDALPAPGDAERMGALRRLVGPALRGMAGAGGPGRGGWRPGGRDGERGDRGGRRPGRQRPGAGDDGDEAPKDEAPKEDAPPGEAPQDDAPPEDAPR